jgi:hypothetical protein
MKRAWIALAALLLIAVPALTPAAPKRTKTGDAFWTHPDYASLGIESMTFLPVATYDGNLQNAKLVETTFGAALRGTNYRWVSPVVARERLRSVFGGDSALRAIHEGVLKHAHVDSLAAPRLCTALRTDAVLSVRVDLWEKLEVEWNQAGKPSTTVQLKAAIVDSTGRLLWTATGAETAEGTYHDPSSGTVGMRGSSLSTTPITGQAGAPSFDEVLSRIFTRWAPQFPARAITGAPAN